MKKLTVIDDPKKPPTSKRTLALRKVYAKMRDDIAIAFKIPKSRLFGDPPEGLYTEKKK